MRSRFSKAECDFLLDEAETIDPDHPSLETQHPVKLNDVLSDEAVVVRNKRGARLPVSTPPFG